MAVQVLGRLGADLGQLRSRVIQGLEDDPEESSEYYPPPRRGARPHSAVLDLLDTIDERLSAIERQLGIAREHDTDPGNREVPAPPG